MMKLNRKNKYLLAGFILALVVCYKFAISNTIAYYIDYKKNRELAANNPNDPVLIRSLVEQERQLSAALESYNAVTDDSFQNLLLESISGWSRDYALKITEFKEPHIYMEKGGKSLYYAFAVEGSFNGILLLLNRLENTPSLGMVKHLHFQKKRNYKNNTDYLVTEILLKRSEAVKVNRK